MTKKERKRLARDIARIMQNPATPQAILDSLEDNLIFFNGFADWTNSNVIEQAIKAYDAVEDAPLPEIAASGGIRVVC